MLAFLREDDAPGEASEWLTSTSNALYLTKTMIYVVQTLIGDGFMVSYMGYVAGNYIAH